jgi:hypothetical protein
MGSYEFDGHYSHRGPCVSNANGRWANTTGPNSARCDKSQGLCPTVMLTREIEEAMKLTPAQKADSKIVWTCGEGKWACVCCGEGEWAC